MGSSDINANDVASAKLLILGIGELRTVPDD
jgi:hypothetical protein